MIEGPCSFCDKPRKETKKLFEGKAKIEGGLNVVVCDECVELFHDLCVPPPADDADDRAVSADYDRHVEARKQKPSLTFNDYQKQVSRSGHSFSDAPCLPCGDLDGCHKKHVDYGGGACWFCGSKVVIGEACLRRMSSERCPVCHNEAHAFDCR